MVSVSNSGMDLNLLVIDGVLRVWKELGNTLYEGSVLAAQRPASSRWSSRTSRVIPGGANRRSW
jgi:hypothetical protein